MLPYIDSDTTDSPRKAQINFGFQNSKFATVTNYKIATKLDLVCILQTHFYLHKILN